MKSSVEIGAGDSHCFVPRVRTFAKAISPAVQRNHRFSHAATTRWCVPAADDTHATRPSRSLLRIYAPLSCNIYDECTGLQRARYVSRSTVTLSNDTLT